MFEVHKNHLSVARESGLSNQGKWLAGGFSLAMIGAVLWPLVENWREKPQDNFPLSYYPMFSAKRSKKAKVSYLVGYDSQGQRHILSYKLAGSGGMNQVRRQIRFLVKHGYAEKLCHDVAERVAQQQTGILADIVRVQVVTGTYRLDTYFHGDRQPLSEQVHAEYILEETAS
ncbi:MAG: hypothetical protein GFH27_549285n189 [Chloroflexi bacterium AL-W]|nr:hypothetical protein [Chloroflexi bacterium AL-N1]NOK65701.1 hypothetical protein [Chloroflexi bacterium AL-N10]NOK74358.1 hypothetical protein [Chloroflexi bacterium AL-N5]NOK80734.1 hypothetical protein [Chloroflexi bacterium AL-W]NOK88616.1 hypothetical protein [Chloroflexi bacterium AL-N15]